MKKTTSSSNKDSGPRYEAYTKYKDLVRGDKDVIVKGKRDYESENDSTLDAFNISQCCYGVTLEETFVIPVISSKHSWKRSTERIEALTCDEAVEMLIKSIENSGSALQGMILDCRINEEIVVYSENYKAAFIVVAKGSYLLLVTVVDREPLPRGYYYANKTANKAYITKDWAFDEAKSSVFYKIKYENCKKKKSVCR